MLSHGFIRDYISNGVARIEMYLLLSLGWNRRNLSCDFLNRPGDQVLVSELMRVIILPWSIFKPKSV